MYHFVELLANWFSFKAPILTEKVMGQRTKDKRAKQGPDMHISSFPVIPTTFPYRAWEKRQKEKKKRECPCRVTVGAVEIGQANLYSIQKGLIPADPKKRGWKKRELQHPSSIFLPVSPDWKVLFNPFPASPSPFFFCPSFHSFHMQGLLV